MATKIEKLFAVEGNELYAKRGAIAARQLKAEIFKRKNEIDAKLDALDLEEINLLDVGKLSADSLTPNITGDPVSFVNNLISIDIKRESLMIEKKAVKKAIKKYFTEEEEIVKEG